MRDEPDKAEINEKQAGPLGGQRLADARRAKNVSVGDVAKELHIDEAKVTALEENRFEDLGAAVYAKGYLRKYANFVGANSAEVFEDYYELTRTQGLPTVIVNRGLSRSDLNFSPWALVVALLVVVIVVLYWWLGSSPEEANGAPDSVAVVHAEPESQVIQPALEEESETIAEADSIEDVSNEPAIDSGVTELLNEPPDSDLAGINTEIELQLSFSGDCWTEISDSTGRSLYVSLARAGTTRRLTGVAPIRVLLGDSQNVRIKVNGDDYGIPDESRSGLTARFTIEKQ